MEKSRTRMNVQLAAITLFTSTVMTSVPRTTNSLTNLPFLNAGSYGSNITDNFVAGDDGKTISESSVLNDSVRVADTTSDDFDENLICFWFSKLDILNNERGIGLFEDGGFVGFGKRHVGDE